MRVCICICICMYVYVLVFFMWDFSLFVQVFLTQIPVVSWSKNVESSKPMSKRWANTPHFPLWCNEIFFCRIGISGMKVSSQGSTEEDNMSERMLHIQVDVPNVGTLILGWTQSIFCFIPIWEMFFSRGCNMRKWTEKWRHQKCRSSEGWWEFNGLSSNQPGKMLTKRTHNQNQKATDRFSRTYNEEVKFGESETHREYRGQEI